MSSELVIVLITAAASVVSSSGVWAYLQTRSKHHNAEARMIKGIGYTTLMSQCIGYLDRGKITPGEFTELTMLLYEPYKALDGNGSAGGNVTCDDIEGSVYAGGNVICDEIGGSATAGGTVGCGGDTQGRFHFSMGNQGKKKQHIHITSEDPDGDASEEDGEDPDDRIEGRIEKFVNDIIRKSMDFLP